MTVTKKEQGDARQSFSRAFLSGRVRTVLPGVKAQLSFWPLFLAGVTLDLWSKSAIFEWLKSCKGGSFSIINGFLGLVMAVNNGAAFGIASGKRYFLIFVSLVALMIIFSVFLFGGARQKLVHIALALVAAGVCGNLYDRIFNEGLVRDFIDVVCWPGKHWPAFNFADSMLCIGVGLLIISIFGATKCTS